MISNQKKRVLIVAYLFPPIGGGGVQRALKMAKYLGEFGWEPHVLTVNPNNHVTLDNSLLEQLPKNVHIHRANEFNFRKQKPTETTGLTNINAPNQYSKKIKKVLKTFKNTLLVPDDQIFWLPSAIKLGTEVINNFNIDVILSTSGPYTNHLVGMILKKKTNKVWIADFRDPWTQNMHRPNSKIRCLIEEKLEHNVMKSSDVILTVTKSFAENFQRKYKDEIKRLEVIHNGYDNADYENITPVYNNNIFTMVYAGIFYKERNPKLLLTAIRQLIDEGKLEKHSILLKFAGVFDYPGYSDNIDKVNELNLQKNVQLLGNLPHSTALSEMKGASVLLLINDITEDAGSYIPGKLFEYMAVKNPILALSLPGESTEIIRKYKLGEVVDPTSVEDIKKGILHLYKEWVNGADDTAPLPEDNFNTEYYQRKYQAKQLAHLMDELLPK